MTMYFKELLQYVYHGDSFKHDVDKFDTRYGAHAYSIIV